MYVYTQPKDDGKNGVNKTARAEFRPPGQTKWDDESTMKTGQRLHKDEDRSLYAE